jgi:hypothetical protein
MRLPMFMLAGAVLALAACADNADNAPAPAPTSTPDAPTTLAPTALSTDLFKI